MPKTNSANQYASLTLPRQGFVVPDVGNGADCGESRSSFQRCWLPVSGFGVHGTVAERVNSSPNLLDVGEMGVYSSYTKMGVYSSYTTPATSTIPTE